MKAINILKALKSDPHTNKIVDCWARSFSLEECITTLENDPQFEDILFSHLLIERLFLLLDEQQSLDFDEFINSSNTD